MPEKIFVECKPDEALVNKILDVPECRIYHASNRSGVVKRLRKNENCAGMVDNDPGKPKSNYYKNEFVKIDENKEFDFWITKHKSTGNILIELVPDLETWIINFSKKNGISLKEFSLSDNPGRLHRIINQSLTEFIIFLEFLKENENFKKFCLEFNKTLLENKG